MFSNTISTIDLVIAASKFVQVFPLPISNQYQIITDLKIGSTAKTVIDSKGNTNLLILAANIHRISFKHQPVAVEKDLNTSQIDISTLLIRK